MGPTNSAVVVLVPRNRPPCDVSFGGSSLPVVCEPSARQWKRGEKNERHRRATNRRSRKARKCVTEKRRTPQKETREQSTDEQDVTGVLHEVRDRGGVDLVRGRDDRRRMEETSGTANEKGTEVKGNMGAKGI